MTISVQFSTHSHTAKVVFEKKVDGEWQHDREQIVGPQETFNNCVFDTQRMTIEEVMPE